ncbi:MAG: hypothetical protein UHH87_07335, partial [Akkermansia sp.]|nr:hypothetical protein [Akkermansia sp.]
PPALGQGAVALECRKDDPEAQQMLARVNHAPTYRCISCEREFLNLLQADCSVPVGGYARINDDGTLTLHVVHYAPTGQRTVLQQTGSCPESVAAALHAELLDALKN